MKSAREFPSLPKRAEVAPQPNTSQDMDGFSCPAFNICLENVDFPVDVAKSLLCSLNLV
jgi:hypothetical protein